MADPKLNISEWAGIRLFFINKGDGIKVGIGYVPRKANDTFFLET